MKTAHQSPPPRIASDDRHPSNQAADLPPRDPLPAELHSPTLDPPTAVESEDPIAEAEIAEMNATGSSDSVHRESAAAEFADRQSSSSRSPSKRSRDLASDGNNPTGGWLRRGWRVIGRASWTLFCLASLVALLALVTAIPVVQVLTLGYLLLVAGRLASGGSLRESVAGLSTAGTLGMAVLAIVVIGLPVQLMVHWAAVADIVQPGSTTSMVWRILALLAGCAGCGWLAWAWARGGRLRHYLWPQPKRFFREAFRWSTWMRASDNLWNLAYSLHLPRLFWLGVRAFAGTLVWLTPAVIIMVVNRLGESDAAGVPFLISLAALGWVLLYLPMLQTQFAADNDWRSLFQWRKVRGVFAAAPWSWATAMLIGLVLMPIPLYLLKVEATPREITWLPCLVFVAFMLPARIAEGLAMRRGRRLQSLAERGELPMGKWRLRWRAFSRWTARLVVMPTIIVVYLAVLIASQYTSWDGLETWIAQHALLVPVPFVGV